MAPAMRPDSAKVSAVGGSLDRLVALVVERLDTADVVAAAKWAAGDQGEPVIDDPVREAEVYDAVARLARGNDLPESWVRQAFFGQIEANKTVQRGLILRWRWDRTTAPTTPTDLGSVRPVIDRVNAEILEHMVVCRAELTAPDCLERLARIVFGVFATGRGDTLHRIALLRAVAALCPVRMDLT
ncbi:chorismate mutase [Nocardia sp. CNY236]|uniref:chorismate mutase n=1 Tax=Nocardia sp. CNY236 TaxID=1169152 RepID=UPI0012DCE818|nr:chorismate mutase [Nocardia sp. CNY236]